MRKKRFLATAMVAALAMGSLPLNAMAAGGTIDVDVTTKTGVLRVEVPTKMVVAVNQFEVGDAGSQITSDEFDIVNKSEMPVKVKVDSTVTLGTDVTLVATKEGAEDSTEEKGEVWLAAAVAKVESDGSLTYDDPKTVATGSDVPETLATLTEENANVGTFAAADGKLSQSFYLGKGTMDNDGDDPVYKVMLAKEAGKFDVSYAQFYKLTTAPASITSETTLRAALADGTVVYELEVTGMDDAMQATGYNVHAVFDKDDAGTATFDDMSYAYYTAADTEATADSVAVGDLYLYSEMKNAGGKTSFRYIGKLGAGKETWTDADISHISIAYDIAGVTESRYGELVTADELVNGLYVASVTTVTGTKLTKTAANGDFTTPDALATQWKSGYTVSFVFDTETYDVSALEVQKIVVDGTEYEFTASAASNTTNNDGKTYKLTNFTAATATQVEVYYGDENGVVYKVVYDLS